VRPKNAGLIAALLAVEPNGNGAVVAELDFHEGAEYARLQAGAEALAQALSKLLEERLRQLGRRSAIVAGAVALFGIGVEGKLAHEKQAALHIFQAVVHYAGGVVKYPELKDLAFQPLHIGRAIGFFYAQEDHQAGSDAPGHSFRSAYLGLANAL